MFKDETYRFQWKDLGDIEVGRPNLGNQTNVVVYRLMQFTMREALVRQFGVDKANTLFFEAGKLAGTEFSRHLLDCSADLSHFIAQLYDKLLELKIGILRVEKADIDTLHLVLTISEDLDCSGLPIAQETVCDYDEGFIAGILESYLGREFLVKEVDCWSTGERTCRFEAKPLSPPTAD
jgi:uncharacterized protein